MATTISKKVRVALRASFQVTIKDKYYLQILLTSLQKDTSQTKFLFWENVLAKS